MGSMDLGKIIRTTVFMALCGGVAVSCRESSATLGGASEPTVRILSGAYAASDTRVDYEHDAASGIRRVVWAEGDALQVAAFSETGRIDVSGSLWSRFGMVTDTGFDKEYMRFAGDALIPAAQHGTALQRLYAFYPASALNDVQRDEATFPTIQKYKKGSFDTDAVILVSAPVEAEIPVQGSVETAAFRMRHYTGYLQLFPKNLPADISDEIVSEISIESPAGKAMSGIFTIGIDSAAAEWRFDPAGENSNRLKIDCSNAGIKVEELQECWFAMLPGLYEKVVFTVRTDIGSVITMERSGLQIQSGVVNTQDINFRSGDVLKKAVVIDLDGSDLDIGGIAQTGEKSGVKDGVEFSYTQLKYILAGDSKLLGFNRKGAALWNTTPLPSPIVRVELDHTDSFAAKFTYVNLGTSLNYEFSSPCSAEGVNCIYSSGDKDVRYVRIENKNSGKSDIRKIRIICAPVD